MPAHSTSSICMPRRMSELNQHRLPVTTNLKAVQLHV
jgi:hypothetical protein